MPLLGVLALAARRMRQQGLAERRQVGFLLPRPGRRAAAGASATAEVEVGLLLPRPGRRAAAAAAVEVGAVKTWLVEHRREVEVEVRARLAEHRMQVGPEVALVQAQGRRRRS